MPMIEHWKNQGNVISRQSPWVEYESFTDDVYFEGPDIYPQFMVRHSEYDTFILLIPKKLPGHYKGSKILWHHMKYENRTICTEYSPFLPCNDRVIWPREGKIIEKHC